MNNYVHPFSLAPSFVALLAQEEVFGEDGNQKTPPGFLVMHLPFHDDIRDVPIDFPNVEIDEDQLNAAKAIIKKMKLRQFDTSAFENPALQSHYKLVEALALQKEDVEDLTFDRYKKHALKKYDQFALNTSCFWALQALIGISYFDINPLNL